jgi:hypothetical protein
MRIALTTRLHGVRRADDHTVHLGPAIGNLQSNRQSTVQSAISESAIRTSIRSRQSAVRNP